MKRLVSAIGLVLISATASAQDSDFGSRLLRKKPAEIPRYGMSVSDKVRYTVNAFGVCAIGRHRGEVEKALAAPFDSRRLDDLGVQTDCLVDGEVSMSGWMIRGALFGALYQADFATKPGAIAAAPLDFKLDAVVDSSLESIKYVVLHEYADCVVRTSPEQSRTAVLAPVASSRENAAYSALGPALGSCMNKGETLTFSKIVLAGLLAEALYREARAAPAAAPTARKD